MMQDINKIRNFYKLKKIHRVNTVENRKESPAEHSWSCMVLADFFLSKTDKKIDKLRVYELLMYHDVVEIEAGDTPLHPDVDQTGKKERELIAYEKLKEEFPAPLNERFKASFEEFEGQKTIESRFAKAIDALDAVIHELDYKEDWKGWDEEFLIEKKAALFEEFPKIKKAFENILNFAREEGYWN